MKYLYIILLQILISIQLFSQDIVGVPSIKNYPPKEINAGSDNWAIAQDKRGIMYFGNSQGLIQYNGYSWELLPNSDNTAIRSIAISHNNLIYSGGLGEIGYYFPNKVGELYYISLLPKIPLKHREFGDVWKTYTTKNKVIFLTNEKIFIYENNKISVIEPKGLFHFGYLVEDDFYVLDRGFGLKKLVDNYLVETTNGSFFANDKIYSLFKINKSKLLVGTRRGIFEYDLKTNLIVPFKNEELNRFVIENEIYDGIRLHDGSLAFSSLLGGLIILENNNIRIIDESSGIQDRCIHSLFEDKDNGLWLSLENGISKINATSQISFFNKKHGLPDRIISVLKTADYIYCHTLRDVFAAKLPKTNNGENTTVFFKKIATIPGNCIQLKQLNINNKEHFLLTTYSGVFEIKETNLELLTDWPTVSISESKKKNIFWLSTKFGVSQLKFQNDSWEQLEIDTIFDNTEVTNIIEPSLGKLLIFTSNNGVFKSNYNYDLKKFSNSIICDSNEIDIPLFTYPFYNNEHIFLSKIVGVLEYSKSQDKFIPCNYFGNISSRGQFKPSIFDKNNSLFTSYNDSNGFKKIKFFKPFKKGFVESKTELGALENLLVYNFFVDSENKLWIASAEGLYLFNNKNETEIKIFNAFITEFSANDSLISSGIFTSNNKVFFNQPNSEIKVLDFEHNTIKIKFSSSIFTNESEVKYSYYLEGLEDGFSKYTKIHECNYNKLKEGYYKFHLKALNTFGFESKIYTYSFIISPPWYRTWWSYLTYLFLIIGAIYFIIQLSVRRLKKAKALLEATVIERTKEIVLEKENVEIQKKIVEEKNKDITDSINYAQRIQQAILPVDSDIKDLMPESFILFKPRDIVSGDFYWFSKISNFEFLIACVDCTGHGVPGAFMSMIGNTLLNEIVNQKNVTEPSLILNELNLGVRHALKQNQENTQSRDGMDIALVKFNIQSKKLEYSGANRPLFIVDSNLELIEIKADKFPIGGLQDSEKRIYTNHVLTLSEKTCFYITTDGYADQFGGVNGKKFMVKKLKELILQHHNLEMKIQKNVFDTEITNWMSNKEQVDDILLIGFKVL